MKQEQKEYTCKYCGKIYFTTRGAFSSHMKYCSCNPKSNYNKQVTSKKVKEYVNKQKELDEITRKEYKFICQNCNKEYILNLTDKEYNNHKYSNFCSKFCARSYSGKGNKNKYKKAKCVRCGKQITIKLNASINTCTCKNCKGVKHNCIVCGKEFYGRSNKKICSDECKTIYLQDITKYLSKETLNKFRETGKKSAKLQSEIRRSKNEIMFYELCEKYFNNVKHNETIFDGWDADVIIEDIKFAILWNGPCHYKPIFGDKALNRAQIRDKIKIKIIEKYNYIPYIIEDMGLKNNNFDFVKEKFDEFIEYLKKNNYI